MAGTMSWATDALACAPWATRSGTMADTCGATAYDPNTVMMSRTRNAALTEAGMPRGAVAAVAAAVEKDALAVAPHADATLGRVLLGGLAGVFCLPKNCAKRTSFQTLSGVLTANTAADMIDPEGTVSLSRNLSSKVSVLFAVKYVTAYRVQTMNTGLVEKKRRGSLKGQRRCFAKPRISGRPVETLSTTDLF